MDRNLSKFDFFSTNSNSQKYLGQKYLGNLQIDPLFMTYCKIFPLYVLQLSCLIDGWDC